MTLIQTAFNRRVASALLVLVSTLTFAHAQPLTVFLLAGQSNMDGRADANDLPLALQSPQTDVLFYEGGVLRDLQPGSGTDFGPEITFGRTLADAFPGESFALIKYGTSGTDLANNWDPNTGPNYSTFNTIVSNGLTALTNAGYSPTIAGMLWTQGERDARNGRTTIQYESDLNEFIADIRTRYGTDLPFYLSQLSINQTDLPSTSLAAIRAAQANVASTDPHSYLINTDTFGMQSDNLHFNSAGQQSLGIAFANQVSMSNPPPPPKSSTAKFDFGDLADGFQQSGWTQFEIPFSGALGPQTTPDDPSTGWSVTLNPSVNNITTPILSRNRDPLDATTGPGFSLNDVYVDFSVTIETVSILGLNPSDTYDVQFIMYDDNGTPGRTQTVTNVTNGTGIELGTSSGPGGGTNLDSDLDFSVFGASLLPNSSGELNFLLSNSATGNRSLLNGVIITNGSGIQTSMFDLGRSDDSGLFQQSGWSQFEIPTTANSVETSAPDPSTGWSLQIGSPTTEFESLLGRSRDPLDAAVSGTFTLDDVYIDFITGVDSLEINGLNPSKTYDVQLIMYDDDGSPGRTQTVTNITAGASDVLGTTPGPGSPAANLTSDLDFSVFGFALSPDANGRLILDFENSATIDRSLISGVIITELTSGLTGDFNNDGVVDAADYTVWRDNLGAPTDDPLNGNGDGQAGVTGGDYIVWRNNFGATNMAAVSSNNAAVPEPSAIVLIIFGLSIVLATRMRLFSMTCSLSFDNHSR